MGGNGTDDQPGGQLEQQLCPLMHAKCFDVNDVDKLQNGDISGQVCDWLIQSIDLHPQLHVPTPVFRCKIDEVITQNRRLGVMVLQLMQRAGIPGTQNAQIPPDIKKLLNLG